MVDLKHRLSPVFKPGFRVLKEFAGNARGSVAMIFGVAAPMLIAAGGVAIDYGMLSMQRNKLQGAVDAATLAAAAELQLANTEKTQIFAVAKSVLERSLGKRSNKVAITVDITSDRKGVTVTANAPVKTYFMDWTKGGDLSVTASAGVHTSDVPLCLLGLSQKKDGAKPGVTLNQNAKLSAYGCAVYSNGTERNSIQSLSGALLEAGLICTVGGAKGRSHNFDPAPVTDCPKFPDPLKNRPEPTFGSCDYTDFHLGLKEFVEIKRRQVKEDIRNETAAEDAGRVRRSFTETVEKPVDTSVYDRSVVILDPGVYCGGITIGGGITARFNSGDYIIKDGPLYVTEEATIEGEHVGFFFTGKHSSLYFGPRTSVSLSAPTHGDLAGLLFFEERFTKKVRPHAILSDAARKLEGTIYLPAGHLYIDADAPIADKSAYTAIIASRLELFAGPHLVLNTDYNETDVPVPEGVSNMRGEVYLTK